MYCAEGLSGSVQLRVTAHTVIYMHQAIEFLSHHFMYCTLADISKSVSKLSVM